MARRQEGDVRELGQRAESYSNLPACATGLGHIERDDARRPAVLRSVTGLSGSVAGSWGNSWEAENFPTANEIDEVAPRSYFVGVHAVGLKVLKNRLSEYVRLAASGETILVTDRERVVAELVPPQAGRASLANDALVAEAVRKGWLTPALGARDESVPRRPVTTLGRLMTELERDRADR